MSLQEQPEQSNNAKKAFRLLRNLWRRVENFVFALVVLFIAFYFFLQLPFVQNWIVQRATTILSEDLQTEVHLSNVRVEFFDNLVFDHFFVADRQGDTLLYAGKLSASLNSNFFALLGNKIEFNEVTLQHARINIRREEGQYENNIQFFIDYFRSDTPKPKKQPRPFRIKVQKLELIDTEFLSYDAVRGQKMLFRLPSGVIRVKEIELASGIVDLQSVRLSGLLVDMESYPSKPLPEKTGRPPARTINLETDSILTKPEPLKFNIAEFELSESRFEMDKFREGEDESASSEVMDFDHMLVDNIAIKATDVAFNGDLAFTGILQHLSAREKCGFELTHAEAGRVVVNDTITALYNSLIQTPGSSLGDTLVLHYGSYRDYLRFNNKVALELRLNEEARLRLGDIMHFSSAINNNRFFIDNKDEVAEISGDFTGRINRLRGRDLNIRVGPSAYMRGDFDGDDLAEGVDRMRLSFDFKRLQSDMFTLRKVVNGFSAPEYFNRLGNIGFSGKYFIFFGYNHVITGQLDTDLGAGAVDMELDLTGGKERATYSGYLSMNQFDLGAWTGNDDFGNTTFKVNIAEGSRGLTLKTIKTTLNGTVDTFNFKGYNYRNIVMNGTFDEQVFDGKLGVDDPNIDFTFVGTINLQDTMPDFDFKADIRRLDLGALNLVSEDWVLSGKVDKLGLRFSNLTDLTGMVRLSGFRILQDREFVHRIDTLLFTSAPLPNGLRSYNLESDVASVYMEGRFDAAKVVGNLGKLFAQNYPKLAGQLGIADAPDSVILKDQFKLQGVIHNSKNFTRLFVEGLETLRNVELRADVNADSNLASLSLVMPELKFRGFEFRSINVNFRSKNGLSAYHFSLPETTLPGQQKIAAVNVYGSLVNDIVKFGLQAQDTSYIIKSINLNGELTTVDSLWEVHFNPSNIVLFNESWYMDDDNFVRFGKEYFTSQNFDLMNGNQRIVIDSFNNGRGLSLAFTNFDLNFIDKYFKTKALTYRGRIYDFDIKVGDIFTMQDMNAFISTDTIFINEHAYGEFTGNLEMANLKSPLRCKMFVIDNDSRLRVAGAWVPNQGVRINDEELGVIRPGEFQTHITTESFPLQVLELFVPGISKTSGLFNTDVRLGGPTSRVGMQGSALITRGQFQLDYLKTMYHIKNQTIKLSNYLIWADGDTIYDGSERNAAVIRGGLRHNFFKDWQLDCSIESLNNEFMILNTRAEDNSTYYGQGIGKFKADFSGSFVRTNIVITATTGKESRLYIPIGTSGDAAEANFITFKSKIQDSTSINKSKYFNIKDLKGVNVEMNLTITNDAEVQLIFDEQAGDIVKGRGEGDIIITINREGEFKMYGNYTIQRGAYMFTLLNWVNKPFTVAQGGTINWYGDPYGAQINLDATYEENTSLYNLLRNELESTGDQQLITEASKATKVIVTMHLKGDLIKPNISFDMAFPNLTSRLKSLADNKLRLLSQDQNELTRQVFGLVVVGSFLPSSSSSAILQSGDYLESAFNTLTQVLSNQFSNYLTGLATEWFGGKVSSIDFDIAYNEYRNDVLTDPNSPTLSQVGRDVQLRLTSGFANDRVTVQVGSQFGVGYAGTISQSGFLGEDITVEIQLTENREWRLKVYQRTEPDIAGGRSRSRFGAGLSFRRDYGSFSEMMDGLTGWFKG